MDFDGTAKNARESGAKRGGSIDIDPLLPVSERLEIIKKHFGNPRSFESGDGVRVKICYNGSKTIDDVLFEYFTKV